MTSLITRASKYGSALSEPKVGLPSSVKSVPPVLLVCKPIEMSAGEAPKSMCSRYPPATPPALDDRYTWSPSSLSANPGSLAGTPTPKSVFS